MQPIDRHVGQRIQLRRESLGQAQSWVAESLGHSIGLIEAWEAGGVRVGGSQLFHLAALLDVPLAWFFEELSTDLSDVDPHAKPLLVNEAIALLHAQAPQAGPSLGARMRAMARSLEQAMDQREWISRQVMTELTHLLSQWRRTGS